MERAMKRLLNTLYVTTPQVYAHLKNENVVISKDGNELAKVPLRILEGIVLFGSLGVSPALMGACVEKGIALSFMNMNGRFLARVDGTVPGNVLLRREQYRAADDKKQSLTIAQRFVAAKVTNQRTVLQRFRRDYRDAAGAPVNESIDGMGALLNRVCDIEEMASLRGLEGKAADLYFSVFNQLILSKSDAFVFAGRNRRPPTDPVNALLFFYYSLFSHDVAAACGSVGLDPYVGYLHVDRSGRLGLALDLMEEMRAQMVDRFVLSMINRKQVNGGDFEKDASGAVVLKDAARKKTIGLWQERKREEIVHPFLQERVPLGLIPYVQAALLAKYIRNELDDYPAYIWK